MIRTRRIVINGRFISEDPTGVQRFAEQIVLALNRLRSDVVLAAPRGPVPAALQRVPVEQFGRSSGSVWEQLELPRYLASAGRPLLLNLANRTPLLYRPKVVTMHDLMVQRGIGSFSRRFRVAFRASTRIGIASGVDALVTVSAFSKREIEDYYGFPSGRTQVVPNAVDGFWSEADGSDRSPALAPFLLAFGRSGRNRDTGVVVDAAEALHRAGRALPVKWVGAPDPALVTRLASVSAPHEVLGRVSDVELRALYRDATAFIAPSLYEGFDLPPLEAQAAGTVVVASDIEVHREVLGGGAAYFAPHDGDALARALTDLPGDGTAGRRELLAAARRNTERYSWQRSAATLSALLDGALARHGRHADGRTRGLPGY